MSKGRTGRLVATSLVAVGCAAACVVPTPAAAACRPAGATVKRCVFVTHGAPPPSTPLVRATMHSRRDRRSVVDFGRLTPFTRDPAAIAITIVWWKNRHIVETDSRFEQPPSIPTGTFSWSVAAARRERKWDLWGMAAHESGHALGLAHATSSSDNRLTMSPVEYLNSVRWRTLGRGDVLGLRALYP
jgi:hypothetical protein